MADKKISELDAITGANTAATDVFVVVDTSTGQTKKITREELNNAIEQDVLSSIDIDTINGDFTVNGNINLGDNNKAIFGAGSDLQIYHDGSNSFVKDAGTGNLQIQGNHLSLEDSTGTRFLLGLQGGETRIYNQGNEKLAATTTGIDVTGTVTADGLTVDGDVLIDDGVGRVTLDSVSGSNRLLSTTTGFGAYEDFEFRADNYIFKTSTTERMRINSSGNVGIGTSSPNYELHIEDASGNAVVNIESSTSGYSAVNLGDTNNDDVGQIKYDNATNSMQFTTNTSERMRIDSSGNVLVGTTSYNNDNAGIGLGSSNFFYATRSANLVGSFNRLTSDGNIIDFRKDGTTVGSIGTQGGRLTIGDGDTGLRFADDFNNIQPFNVSTNGLRDNAIDLGSGAGRFRSLFLSGGVYLGGTGSANKLDDYEEGTWTPTLTSNGTAPTITSYSHRVGRYTKVGDMLYVTCFIRAILSAAGTGTPRVSGLPFNTENGVYQPVYTGLITLLNNGTDSQPYSINGNYVQFDGGTSYDADGGNRYLCFSAVFKV